MLPFSTLRSSFIALDQKDIDTDMIIPAEYLKSIGKGGYGKHLFQRLRDRDKSFPLNDQSKKNTQILIARSNFGCGSSREHAVWALLEYGIRVIIAPSFADIFFSNCGKNGLVLIQLPEEIVQKLLQEKNGEKISVNLKDQTVTLWDGTIHRFPFDAFRKECILHGLDDLDYLLREKVAIKKWKKKRKESHFYQTTEKNHDVYNNEKSHQEAFEHLLDLNNKKR